MHNKKPLVSVIIPTFRRADKIERAIKSVLAQTYSDIEIIVVDDNANNMLDRIANRRLLARYPDILLVENIVNRGGGLSRNEGAKIASGALLAFLDDDDEFMPKKIEEQVACYLEASEKRAVGIVYCHAEVIRVDGTTYVWNRLDSGYPLEEHIYSCVAPTTALMIPREVFRQVGGFEDISSRQDASLIMKIIISGYSVEVVSDILYRYFWHDGTNGISKLSKKSLEAEIRYKNIFLSYAIKNNWAKRDVDRVLSIFSVRLVPILLRLDMKKDALREACLGLKKAPTSRRAVVAAMKTIMGPAYILIAMKRERNARLGKIKA